ncbi:WAT1-related protein At3g18200 isoform X2 [Nicotiana tabacum]|uniref:WAT1-related protein At3g18200 isoform X2 n=1 Tax=Nicotiana tabacum TaxID=4097 RepID=A0A1S3ZTQ2_TOBAC|nr:PREDICTED: WAT1-related protein At3g18200-like isoform X3 [Nicotiana tabacum]
MEFTPGKLKLVAALFVMVFCSAGLHIVSRIALNIGVSKIVFILYRNITALLVLGPFAYFLEKKDRPPLTFSLLVQFFFLGLIGVTANQSLYILGLYYTSPTYASAMQNSVPAITFVMASVLRLEEVHIKRRDGMAKILGTIASIGGATIITLYKGPPLLGGSGFSTDITTSPEKMLNRTLGCVYFIVQCLSYAGYMVLQLLVVTAFTERDPRNWRIQSGKEVLTILYVGIIFSGVVYSLVTWCIQKGGPVLTATFQPLQTVVVAVLAFVFLGNRLYSGGVFGGILIAAGVYLVLWGKNEEEKIANQDKEGATLRKHLLDQENTEECPVTVQVWVVTRIFMMVLAHNLKIGQHHDGLLGMTDNAGFDKCTLNGSKAHFTWMCGLAKQWQGKAMSSRGKDMARQGKAGQAMANDAGRFNQVGGDLI